MGTIVVSRVTDCNYSVARPSILGNPFPMKREEERDTVCDKFESYFEQKLLENDPVVLNELRKIRKMSKKQPIFKIGCFCSPRRCHADTIAMFLNNYGNSLDD